MTGVETPSASATSKTVPAFVPKSTWRISERITGTGTGLAISGATVGVGDDNTITGNNSDGIYCGSLYGSISGNTVIGNNGNGIGQGSDGKGAKDNGKGLSSGSSSGG